MSAADQCTAGWIDTTIHDFLAEIKPLPEMKYALVTCLDSSFDLSPAVERNSSLRDLRELKILGSGFFLKTADLLKIERKSRLFFGFDEIWLCSQKPSTAKPKSIVITGPDRIRDRERNRLSEWMEKNHCSLGLGDGTGMNFCAKLNAVGKYLFEAQAASTTAQSRLTS